ncbi:ATP-dependent nuclease [Marinococcus sp. PL1-022]|uniref:ATP-dependent nuclease n=1 Tax=Marinococcus sp. PL1-022 TaxID=3095363 RepID=UPI0029C5A8E7|nr:AAA family ATPase [Marinococcus sp. PL1-022]MDX6152000.1 AAA family ATPase [Marinococcus sp. PL1-022]
MYIQKLKIENYRNLDGLEIKFHEEITFIVGENNLGKSNVLSLINTIFNYPSFKFEDFSNKEKEINIYLSLMLNDEEKGMFDDFFDPENNNRLNLIVSQESPDENIEFKHEESETRLSNNVLKKVLHINYNSSVRSPTNELNFEKGRGTGKFLKFIIKKYKEDINADELDYVNQEKLNDLTKYTNDIIKKLNSFNGFDIKASIHNEAEDLLSRILVLTDSEELDVQSSGHGVQYSLIIGLAILERLSSLNSKKLNEMLYKNVIDDNALSTIFTLDEPEIHLHPYMQRSLIKNVFNIVHNRDSNFKSLLKSLFNIEELNGQVIVVTHSPNILLNNYNQIIRFHRKNDKLQVFNGADLNLSEKNEKHLMMNMQYIKEIFFAKYVVIVEGDSEYGAMEIFADRLGIDLDSQGISILKADGAESITPLIVLLKHFGINSVGVMDKDKYGDGKKYSEFKNLFSTKTKDFEEEIFSICEEKDNLEIIFDIVKNNDDKGLRYSVQKSKLVKTAKSYGIDISNIEIKDYRFNEIGNNRVLLKLMFFAWGDSNKSVVLGKGIADNLNSELIPTVYKEALESAKGGFSWE